MNFVIAELSLVETQFFFCKNERDFSIKYFFKKRLRHFHCYKRNISFYRFAREIYGQPLSHPQEHLGFGQRDTG